MIRFQAPLLPPVPAVAAYFEAAEEARWFSNNGPCHALLVERLEAYLGCGLRCVPLANATSALMLGIAALVHPGEGRRSIALPSFTFAAVVSAVVWAGFEPVFVDVEEYGWHMCPDALERTLAERPIALVLAASTFGSPPRSSISSRWREITAAADVPLLIDSAAGFGARTNAGHLLGGQGMAEVFSFHATKPFAVGEGGLLVSSDGELVDRVARLANFGFRDGLVSDKAGLNAKLAEWPAATALAVLDAFPDVLKARRASAVDLLERVTPHGYIRQDTDGEPAWQFVPVLAPSEAVRDSAREIAAAEGIELRSYFSVPLHRMDAFQQTPVTGALDRTEMLASRVLSLPMANDQTDVDRERIAAILIRAAE